MQLESTNRLVFFYTWRLARDLYLHQSRRGLHPILSNEEGRVVVGRTQKGAAPSPGGATGRAAEWRRALRIK